MERWDGAVNLRFLSACAEKVRQAYLRGAEPIGLGHFLTSRIRLEEVIVRLSGPRKSIVEKFICVTKHNTKTITTMLVDRMSKLNVILSVGFPRYDRRAMPGSSPHPAASLPNHPMELFLWVIGNNGVSSCDIRSLRLTCKEVDLKCRNRFYHAIDKSTVFLQLDAGFSARALALAKYQERSDNITSVHLEVPRNKFSYESEQAHCDGRWDMDTTKDNFADM